MMDGRLGHSTELDGGCTCKSTTESAAAFGSGVAGGSVAGIGAGEEEMGGNRIIEGHSVRECGGRISNGAGQHKAGMRAGLVAKGSGRSSVSAREQSAGCGEPESVELVLEQGRLAGDGRDPAQANSPRAMSSSGRRRQSAKRGEVQMNSALRIRDSGPARARTGV